MSRYAYLLGVTAWLVPITSYAERIYHFVDYPLLQAGHTLQGTITTTDDAPSDAILETEEILAWQWSVMGPNVRFSVMPGEDTFTATHDGHTENGTVATGVSISPTAIELPLATSENSNLAELLLWRFTPGGRGSFGYRLGWSTKFFDDGRGQHNHYRASNQRGDVINLFWAGSFSSSEDSNLLLAIAVPEPSTSALGYLALLGLFFLKRWRE